MEILSDVTTSLVVLHQKSKKVDGRHRVAELFLAMEEAINQERDGFEAVGLSAIQLGVPLRVIAFRYGRLIRFIVNPVITKGRGSQLRSECCLSIPEAGSIRIPRPRQIVVRGLSHRMTPVKYQLSGLEACVVCHEVDHLNGILIADHRL